MTVSQAAWCLYVLMHYYIKRSGGPVPESPTLISLIRWNGLSAWQMFGFTGSGVKRGAWKVMTPNQIINSSCRCVSIEKNKWLWNWKAWHQIKAVYHAAPWKVFVQLACERTLMWSSPSPVREFGTRATQISKSNSAPFFIFYFSPQRCWGCASWRTPWPHRWRCRPCRVPAWRWRLRCPSHPSHSAGPSPRRMNTPATGRPGSQWSQSPGNEDGQRSAPPTKSSGFVYWENGTTGSILTKMGPKSESL